MLTEMIEPLVVHEALTKPTSIGEDDLGVCFYVWSVDEINVQKETVRVGLCVCLFALSDGMQTPEDQLKSIFAEMFFNRAEDTREDKCSLIDDIALKEGVVAAEFNTSLTVKVDMDYTSFPFDVQTVPVFMVHNVKKLISAEHFCERGTSHGYANAVVVTSASLISEEWSLGNVAIIYGKSDPNETMIAYPQATVLIKLQRWGSGYMKRFVSNSAMLSFGALLPLLMPQFEVADILAYEVGLLFAVVAFQLLISSLLPPTGTMSVLDQYSIGLFAFIFTVMLVVAYEAHEEPESDSMRNGLDHFRWLAGVWLTAHVLFASRILQLVHGQQKALNSFTEDRKGKAFVIHTNAIHEDSKLYSASRADLNG